MNNNILSMGAVLQIQQKRKGHTAKSQKKTPKKNRCFQSVPSISEKTMPNIYNYNYTLVTPPTSFSLSHQHLVTPTRFRCFARAVASESAMAANSVRVAAAQITSVNDLAANFSTCSRLVKVNYSHAVFSNFNFLYNRDPNLRV